MRAAEHDEVNPPFDMALIIKAALTTIRAVQRDVQADVASDPAEAFECLWIGVRRKPLVAVDLTAERSATRRLRNKLRRYAPIIRGEESLHASEWDLGEETRLTILLDMVDGTDLLKRGLSNWCSAIVFYHQGRIVAAFVGLPNEG